MNVAFTNRRSQRKEQDGWKLLLDIPLNNLTDGLNDKANGIMNATGNSGVKMFADGTGVQMIYSGVYPRWIINTNNLPCIIDVDINYQGSHGHGWCLEWRNTTDSTWLQPSGCATSLSGASYNFGVNNNGSRIVSGAQYFNNFFSGLTNIWTNVRIVADFNPNGYGFLFDIYRNKMLIYSFVLDVNPQMCHNFSLRHDAGDYNNTSSAGFRNLKMYVKSK